MGEAVVIDHILPPAMRLNPKTHVAPVGRPVAFATALALALVRRRGRYPMVVRPLALACRTGAASTEVAPDTVLEGVAT